VVVRKGLPTTVVTYRYVFTSFQSTMIIIGKQVVPLTVPQCIMVKLVTNENVKPAEILTRHRAKFGDETLSRTKVYDCSNSLEEGQTEVKNMPHIT
jgi:hypothetical protein